MPLADLEIVKIVRRGDFHRPGALLRVGIFVGDDGNAALGERQDDMPAHHVLVAFIRRIHRDRGIAQHRLGTRGRDDDLAAALNRIADVPDMALHVPALDFEIGDRGLQRRVPVHQALVLIDQPLLMQRAEHLAHGRGEPLVHGEALARPVRRGTEAAQLLGDGAAGFSFHCQTRARNVSRPSALREVFLVQQPLHHHLRGDAGMVGAGLPQHVAPLHAAIANENILQHVGQSVADMQRPGHVRRRNHNRVRCGVARRVGGERAGFFPLAINPAFAGGRVKMLIQRAHR